MANSLIRSNRNNTESSIPKPEKQAKASDFVNPAKDNPTNKERYNSARS